MHSVTESRPMTIECHAIISKRALEVTIFEDVFWAYFVVPSALIHFWMCTLSVLVFRLWFVCCVGVFIEMYLVITTNDLVLHAIIHVANLRVSVLLWPWSNHTRCCQSLSPTMGWNTALDQQPRWHHGSIVVEGRDNKYHKQWASTYTAAPNLLLIRIYRSNTEFWRFTISIIGRTLAVIVCVLLSSHPHTPVFIPHELHVTTSSTSNICHFWAPKIRGKPAKIRWKH